MGTKVLDVVPSKRLVDSAVTLVVGKDGMDNQMEKMMRMMNQQTGETKKILEVNMNNPVIKNLAKIQIADSNNSLLKKCIIQLYEGVLLMDGNLIQSADFVKRMSEIMEDATK